MNLNTKIFLIPDWMIFLSFLKRDGKINLSTLNKMSHINYSSLHRIKKELTNLGWITDKDKEESYTYAVLTEEGKPIADIVSNLFDTLGLTTEELFDYRRVKHSLKFSDRPTVIEKPKIEVTVIKEEENLLKEIKEGETNVNANNNEGI
jgi:predicted transcriptional regulator